MFVTALVKALATLILVVYMINTGYAMFICNDLTPEYAERYKQVQNIALKIGTVAAFLVFAVSVFNHI